jgi:hypothetical protein
LRQFDLIASRCASLGACEKAGVAIANVAANSSNAVLLFWIIESIPVSSPESWRRTGCNRKKTNGKKFPAPHHLPLPGSTARKLSVTTADGFVTP